MRTVLFKAVPFVKEDAILALESGADGLIVPASCVAAASGLARCRVIAVEEAVEITLAGRDDEQNAARHLRAGQFVMLNRGWEIIPVENLLAQQDNSAETQGQLALEVLSADEARLAAGILQKGVDAVVLPPEALPVLKAVLAVLKNEDAALDLVPGEIMEITPVGLGHRVCVDTLSVFSAGQGMLTGNSAAFTFLVNAETEHNEYVASRPFRVNAGAVHAYALMPGDRTSYLEELRAGSEVLIADHTGQTRSAVVGRVKIEQRPMLLIRAKTAQAEGTAFLQNAETIRLVTPEGNPVSVVSLRVGDRVLCRVDAAGRHFGMRINEDISEV